MHINIFPKYDFTRFHTFSGQLFLIMQIFIVLLTLSEIVFIMSRVTEIIRLKKEAAEHRSKSDIVRANGNVAEAQRLLLVYTERSNEADQKAVELLRAHAAKLRREASDFLPTTPYGIEVIVTKKGSLPVVMITICNEKVSGTEAWNTFRNATSYMFDENEQIVGHMQIDRDGRIF